MNKIKNIIMGIPKSIYITLLLLLLLVDAMAFNLDQLLKKIEFWNVSAAYNSLTALAPTISLKSKAHPYLLLIFTIIVAGLFLYRVFYKPKLILLKQYSLSNNIASVDTEFLQQFYIKLIDINQFEEMNNYSKITDAIRKQDDIAMEILRKRKTNSLCYYGIAHTPLIFRLGFKIGDENNVKLLHKERANDTLFKELSFQSSFLTLSTTEINKSISSDELIVAVSTSLKITDKEITSLVPKEKHILMFECNNLSFDSITSYKLAESFRNTIMIELRSCVKKYGIRKIHLVLSTSVGFTFYLGQAFSPQHEPETIVYHYQNCSYPWGICVNRDPEYSLVRTEARS